MAQEAMTQLSLVISFAPSASLKNLPGGAGEVLAVAGFGTGGCLSIGLGQVVADGGDDPAVLSNFCLYPQHR